MKIANYIVTTILILLLVAVFYAALTFVIILVARLWGYNLPFWTVWITAMVFSAVYRSLTK